MTRHLYLIGYDIRSARRRRRALLAIKGHAVGGQKSLHECWLSETERRDAVGRLERIVDRDEDHVVVIRLDRGAKVHVRGRAVEPTDDDFFYQG